MRGTAEFTTMKGFLDDYSIKDGSGHTSDTLPPEATGDVTDQAKVEEVKNEKAGKQGANVKAGDNTDDGPATTMSDDVKDIQDNAEKPIDDGYVQDAQGPKVSDGGDVDKGWQLFNEKCADGYIVKDYDFNRNNVGEALARMAEDVDERFEVKCSGGKMYGKKKVQFSEVGAPEEKGVLGAGRTLYKMGRAGGKGRLRSAWEASKDVASGVGAYAKENPGEFAKKVGKRTGRITAVGAPAAGVGYMAGRRRRPEEG